MQVGHKLHLPKEAEKSHCKGKDAEKRGEGKSLLQSDTFIYHFPLCSWQVLEARRATTGCQTPDTPQPVASISAQAAERVSRCASAPQLPPLRQPLFPVTDSSPHPAPNLLISSAEMKKEEGQEAEAEAEAFSMGTTSSPCKSSK